MSLAQATADGWYKRDDPTPETPMLDHDLMPERARTNLKGATQLNQLEQKINKAQQLEAKAAFVPAEPRLAQLLQMEAKEEKVKPMEGTENLFAINVPPPATIRRPTSSHHRAIIKNQPASRRRRPSDRCGRRA